MGRDGEFIAYKTQAPQGTAEVDKEALSSPVVVDQVRAQHHHVELEERRLRLNAKHDGGQFGVIGSVAGGNANPKLPVIPILLHDLLFLT